MKDVPALKDEDVLNQARVAIAALFTMVEEGTISFEHEDDDCPADDSCFCPEIIVANKLGLALTALDYRARFNVGATIAPRMLGPRRAHLVAAFRDTQATCVCKQEFFHEHVYAPREEEPNLEFCYVCFPEKQDDLIPAQTHVEVWFEEQNREVNVNCQIVQHPTTMRAMQDAYRLEGRKGESPWKIKITNRADCLAHGGSA